MLCIGQLLGFLCLKLNKIILRPSKICLNCHHFDCLRNVFFSLQKPKSDILFFQFQYLEITAIPGGQCPCTILKNENSGQKVTIIPPGKDCSCQVVNNAGFGEFILGDPDSHPLTAGEEHFFTIRTSSGYGLQSSPIFIAQSLRVDQVVATNNRIEAGIAKFDIKIESGGGSKIWYKLFDGGERYNGEIRSGWMSFR